MHTTVDFVLGTFFLVLVAMCVLYGIDWPLVHGLIVFFFFASSLHVAPLALCLFVRLYSGKGQFDMPSRTVIFFWHHLVLASVALFGS